jgi:hypothetical protein
MMFEESQTPTSFRKEELRGLFSLGLLAVAAAIRIQNIQINLVIGETTHNVTPFFDVTIILWSFYAFFMVLGLSDDIIGIKASQMFRSMSIYYLYFSFIILGFLASILFYELYPTRMPWVLLFLFLAFGYFVFKKTFLWAKSLPRERKAVKQSLSENLKRFTRRLKRDSYQFLLSGFFTCFMLVLWGIKEELVIPSAIIGSILLISFLIARDLLERKDKESQSIFDA